MNIIQKVILWSLYVYGNFCIYEIVFNNKISSNEERCGVVIDKKQPTTMDIHKHSANIRISEYLYVKYGKRVDKEWVDTNTYYLYNVGDKVCLIDNRTTGYGVYCVVVGGITTCVNVMFIILFIIILWMTIGGTNFIEAFNDVIKEVF
jgi:hypothetical protein